MTWIVRTSDSKHEDDAAPDRIITGSIESVRKSDHRQILLDIEDVLFLWADNVSPDRLILYLKKEWSE